MENKYEKNTLKIFDKAYFDFYYLSIYLTKMKNKKILEIGPGYGSIAQKIMSVNKTKYISIDVANGPIQIIKKNKKYNKKVYCFKGDILDIKIYIKTLLTMLLLLVRFIIAVI